MSRSMFFYLLVQMYVWTAAPKGSTLPFSGSMRPDGKEAAILAVAAAAADIIHISTPPISSAAAQGGHAEGKEKKESFSTFDHFDSSICWPGLA